MKIELQEAELKAIIRDHLKTKGFTSVKLQFHCDMIDQQTGTFCLTATVVNFTDEPEGEPAPSRHSREEVL